MMQRLVRVGLELYFAHAPHGLDRRRRMDVIHESRRSGKSLVSDELLGVDASARLLEGNMPLAGNLSERVIDRHVYRLPRRSCSRSSASNSALKFPAPKLFAPFL